MSYAKKQVERLAGRATHQYRLIEHQDKILVGVSGGKDSLCLLKFLVDRLRRAPITFEIIAAHINAGYDSLEGQAALKSFCESLGVQTIFEDTDYGLVAHSPANRENPCYLCARLRRSRLFRLAEELGCQKLALGHNRDDFIETLLMNIFYSGEISSMVPKQPFFGGKLTVIRPLCLVPEDNIKRLVKEEGWPIMVNLCPSAGGSKRAEVKEIIAQLARQNRKVPANIFNALGNVRLDYLIPQPDASPLPLPEGGAVIKPRRQTTEGETP